VQLEIKQTEMQPKVDDNIFCIIFRENWFNHCLTPEMERRIKRMQSEAKIDYYIMERTNKQVLQCFNHGVSQMKQREQAIE
jgi:hypothetical protein